ncbi:MAG: hypothetical protein DI536_04280 [Archangium gephyra]|uniref:Uncharacterized protein n=1 Tax=Archangium gephyra TaxID=48 RepID=A0A2W5TU26_9BACT|nr:MAG: hypothetical protein DI536_04280 [Archangium gephyra]
MRKLVLVVLAFAAVAFAQSAITLDTSRRAELTCTTDGSASVYLAPGKYVTRVTGADSRLCFSQTPNSDGGTVCGASDGGVQGELFPTGTVMTQSITGNQQRASCRSTGAGVVVFTGAQ